MSVVFDRAVAFYDRTRGLPQQAETWMAQVVGEDVPLAAGSKVLEIGVGTGRIALPLIRQNRYRYTGIDLSRSMMDVLRTKADSEQIALVQGDAERLPFADGAFDAVVGVHIFHLISGWQQAMDEVLRVLRPGGLLLHGRNSRVDSSPERQLRDYLHSLSNQQEQSRDPGLLEHDQIAGELEQRFGKPRELQTPSWTVTQTPGEILDMYADRCWSATWSLSDETLARAVAEGRRLAIERFGSLDAPLKDEQLFKWNVYRRPETRP
ncbi:MAG: methyltransferase domain-containing protein [Chloroflexi bacterium]|nr:methyltransferase domain-containing protein [Chloroflexota bacterium]